MAGSLLLGISSSGQAGLKMVSPREVGRQETHLGYPQDWSSRHLLMPGMRADDVSRQETASRVMCTTW